ncbi:amidohydrolase family protein [Echinicola arenosa]|nr:amidohydrolase family protein [Echinicola arenosa]
MIKRQNTLMYLVLMFCLLFINPAFAQSDHSGQRRITGTYAITNATVFTQPGKSISSATIILKDGLIKAVGNDLNIPIDAQVIKGDSLFVYAGFIDVASEAGVSKPEDVKRSDDMDPSDPSNEVAGITPEREVLQYWDINNGEITNWRKAGFSIAQLVPKGEMLPGQTALVVYGDKESTNILAESTGLYAQFETARGVYPGTILGLMAKWRELYKNAQLKYEHASLFKEKGNGINRPEKDPSLEAFYKVINGQIPVVFEAEDELEIRRVLRLKKELGFDVVITGVKEGSKLAEDIKGADAKIVLSLDLPDDKASKAKMEDATEEAKKAHERVVAAYKEALSEAASFEAAGIPFAFSSKGAKNGDVFKNIQTMIENGLSEEGALAALTTNPANMLGISSYTGTVEKGKLANLVLTTDSLFSKDAKIKYVMADGYLFEYEASKSKKKNENVEDVVGKWNYTSETPGGTSKGTITFAQESGNLKGEILVDDPDGSGQVTRQLENVHYDGKELSYTFSIIVQGQEIVVNTKGTLSGNEFEGNLSIKDMGTFPFTATKEPDFNL